MATTYRTPGVYIEEITKFPPAIAQVQTAIPAFIGYTEKATKKVEGDLHLKPKRITSLLDYETYFGKPQNETAITVSVVDSTIVATAPDDASKSPFLMYYSMQLYFANGGGPCYIVSVGQYGASSGAATAVEFTPLNNGLSEIEKENEPTLLVFPDATSLADHLEFYALYVNALDQCHDLQDRFTIIDTYRDEEYDQGPDSFLPIETLRSKIGSDKDYLKYGAVYYPFLETILDYAYDTSDVNVTSTSSTAESDRVRAQNFADVIDTTTLTALFADLNTLQANVDGAANDTLAVAMIPDLQTKIEEIIDYIEEVKTNADAALAIAREDGSINAEANALDTWITDELENTVVLLNATIDRLNDDTSITTIHNEIASDTANDPSLRRVLGIHDDNAAGDSLVAKIDAILIAGGELADMIAVLSNAAPPSTTVTLDTLETTDNTTFNKIKAEIGILPVTLPPSAAMAGVYARVDNDRGVWKAPANVSLNYVVQPTVKITNVIQDTLNIDDMQGKSINAIRNFTGKGNMVWGARTLAGNDNEWRYVSVRRFFNMVEESVKNATDQFVFEPNDANTWIRVRAMIENFLTLQWRAGALTGAKTDEAFYVKIGLGQTMSADDILNGYMIIEIGMAVVRPAEFIVLKFSHKMQEA